ncbi:major facilitator superfamily transporter [Apiospora phragmitis]|uniref:Major facilitator superfamily transporter n=1 Tax=Apiospora phragmitis TaxID=2905665 RepID=A0ABR1SUQ4_9PEZI
MSSTQNLEKKDGVTVSVVPLSESQVSLSSLESGTPAPGTPSSEKAEDEAPDGGWMAWRQVIAGHFINAISCGYSATFGIYQLYYTEALNLPAAQIAWIGSFQIFLNSLVCLAGGSLSDAGYARHCVWAGSLCVLIGTFMTSIATEYYQIFLAQGVLQGFGLGLMFMPSTSVVSSYFKRKRSLALTIASAGTGTGSIVFPATVQFLIPKIGFAWAVRCSGFVAVVICVVGCLLLKPRLAPRKGVAIVEVKAFKEVPYVLFAVGTWFFYWALYFGFFYITSFALTLPGDVFTPTSTVNLLLVTNAVSTPARVFIGWTADNHLGPFNTYILAVASLAVTLFTWTAVTTGPGMYIWAAAFGITSGAAQAAYLGAIARLTKDPKRIGVRIGMIFGITSFAVLAGPPTAGSIIEATGGTYRWAQVWGGSVELLSVVILLVARRFLTRGLWVVI